MQVKLTSSLDVSSQAIKVTARACVLARHAFYIGIDARQTLFPQPRVPETWWKQEASRHLLLSPRMCRLSIGLAFDAENLSVRRHDASEKYDNLFASSHRPVHLLRHRILSLVRTRTKKTFPVLVCPTRDTLPCQNSSTSPVSKPKLNLSTRVPLDTNKLASLSPGSVSQRRQGDGMPSRGL